MHELGSSTFPLDDNEDEEKKLYGFFWGIVTNNNDSTLRGRVRIYIPGINITESTWAEPVGMPGFGGNKHGLWSVPKVKSNVVVSFIQGDPDHPIYWPGPPPIEGQPDGSSPENIVMQSDNFRISLRETTGSKKLRLETILPGINDNDKSLVESVIEIDINAGSLGKSHAINIKAPTAVTITSKGSINIDAPVVTIKGRNVMPTDRSI